MNRPGVFRRRGLRGILSHVGVTNFDSLRSADEAGCRRIGFVLVTRRLAWVGPAARRYGLAVERRRR